MTRSPGRARLVLAGPVALILLAVLHGRAVAAESAPPSDPARVVAENTELEAEIRALERRWNDGANANKTLARAVANYARVIEQQQTLIAAARREASVSPAKTNP